MPNTSPISLVNFFIFNSTLGPREGEEHKKILYYYPDDDTLDTKKNNVGFCEAIIKFTERFTDEVCETVHTQKHRIIYRHAEKDFWMIMKITIPCTDEGKYHEERVHDIIFNSILLQAYEHFRLLTGTFYYILENSSLQGLKQRLNDFFSKYLLTVRLNDCDILDVFNGIHFLPLDKNTFLRIQCFTNNVEATFPSIEYTIFIYNKQLVWSSLERDDNRNLFNYLINCLLPSCDEKSRKSTSSQAGASKVSYTGQFLTGPTDLDVEDSVKIQVPLIHIVNDTEIKPYHLVIYSSMDAIFCMLMNGSYKLELNEFRNIDSYLGTQLTRLASDIQDQNLKRPPMIEPQYKFIYFNHMNLAEKTTVHSDSAKNSKNEITPELINIISDMGYDFRHVCPVDEGEIILKTVDDCWVIGKKSDQREFYVLITQKNANLIEVNEEIKRLCYNHFSNIFFLD